jgi:hypothetical protein
VTSDPIAPAVPRPNRPRLPRLSLTGAEVDPQNEHETSDPYPLAPHLDRQATLGDPVSETPAAPVVDSQPD